MQSKKSKPMFVVKVVDRFLHPFKEFADHTFLKCSLVAGAMLAETQGVFSTMFDTPDGFTWALFFLVLADVFSKSLKVWYRDGKGKWSAELAIRGLLYKLGSYGLVVFGATIWSNQFGPGDQHVIYVAYAGLGALELISIARHQKVFGYLIAFGKQIAKGKVDFQELKELADKYEVEHPDET